MLDQDSQIEISAASPWLPHKHLEVTTRAAYNSYLNKQCYPAFGRRQLNKVSPSVVQDWVTTAHAEGLSPRSIKKYHVFQSSIFRRAVRDRILVFNPYDHTELPKVILRKSRRVTPDEFERPLRALPSQHRLLVETFIETGMRWGEVIALRPRHIDFLRRMVSVEDTICRCACEASRCDGPQTRVNIGPFEARPLRPEPGSVRRGSQRLSVGPVR
jgi:integrase